MYERFFLLAGKSEDEDEARSADEVEKCSCQMKRLVEMLDVAYPTVTAGGAALSSKVASSQLNG